MFYVFRLYLCDMNKILTNIWEENDLIEPMTKLENNGIIVPNDIIKEIKNKFLKKECEDIGNKKKWKKKCPNCNNEVFYL